MKPPLIDKQLSHDSNMSPTFFKEFLEARRRICATTDVKRSHLSLNSPASTSSGHSMNLLLLNFEENKRVPRSTTLASSGFSNRSRIG
ncbi:unnamed protein product, partial [Sphenostylis stenocarpa]